MKMIEIAFIEFPFALGRTGIRSNKNSEPVIVRKLSMKAPIANPNYACTAYPKFE